MDDGCVKGGDHDREGSRSHRDPHTRVSHDVGWMTGDRRHPGEHRFPARASLIETTTTVERRGKTTCHTRDFISSARLTPERAADAIRSHWGLESLHWVPDVVFKEDLSRLRRGHGARNRALVRRIVFNIVRAGRGKRSIKTAGWTPNALASLIQTQTR